MHISIESDMAVTNNIFGSDVEDVSEMLNSDDQISCISDQICSNQSQYSNSAPKSIGSIVSTCTDFRPKKILNTDSVKGSTTNLHKEDQLEEARIILWHRSKVRLGWSASHPHGAGMVNLGNTCYLNSSLQALFHIPSLANWLLCEIQSHIKGCQDNASCIGFCSICAMMRTIHNTLNTSSNTIKPCLIHNRLKCIGKTLQYGRQEDAHEFIKLLLDHMQRSYILSCRAGKLDHRSKETTPLHQIFGGYLRQQVSCPNCSYVSTTFSHFQDIALDITTVCSVDDALRHYFRKETLDSENAYKCEKCKRRVTATKRYHIEVLPNVLLLQLKRFSLNGGKLNKGIEIREQVNLTNFVWNNKKDQEPSIYKLVSMVNHLGSSQHSGHYTSVAKSSNGSMHEFDDNCVRYISMENALRRNPYLLFYELASKPKNSQIRQIGEIQVRAKNGFVNHKPKVDDSAAGSSEQWKKESPIVNGERSSPVPMKSKRNKISFEIKPKSENSNNNLTNGTSSRMANGSSSHMSNGSSSHMSNGSSSHLSNGSSGRLSSGSSNSMTSTDLSSLRYNNVKKWDGRPSSTFESTRPVYSNKRSAHDSYNEEYDVGRVAKRKFRYDSPVRRQDNPFQSYQNRSQSEGSHRVGGSWSNYGRNNSNHHRKSFNKGFKSYGGGYNRNSYQNKPWQYRGGYRSGNERYGPYKENRT